ncbi:hypothetical protein AWC22_22970 [Mycobacterium riyadhense]|uniref:Uncharacterized protein n=1 Tax=Mycobacterium riyadhense TaxID=486698 RepID=A0A1X2CH97_9MYCO|nr:hypothetical protein AWC22_22970 [Mycobacterium riyadhense]
MPETGHPGRATIAGRVVGNTQLDGLVIRGPDCDRRRTDIAQELNRPLPNRTTAATWLANACGIGEGNSGRYSAGISSATTAAVTNLAPAAPWEPKHFLI